jgi:ubiquinone/menaquinone biosynthesis C-methylase UbiE
MIDNSSNIVSHTILNGHEEQREVNTHFDVGSTYWSDLYFQYDVFGIIHQQRREIAIKYFDSLSLPKESKILEIGCGAGHTTVDLAKRGYKIEAMDIVPAMIELTQKHIEEVGLSSSTSVSIGDAHSLRFSDHSFDCILAMGVIPWLYDARKALQEIVRVLKPNGYVIINTDNRCRLNHLLDPIHSPVFRPFKQLLKWLSERTGLRKPSTLAKPHMYSIKEFEKMLEISGLKVLKSHNLGFGPFTLLNKQIFSDGFGVKLHKRLQHLSDLGYPVLKRTGCQHIVAAQKVNNK